MRKNVKQFQGAVAARGGRQGGWGGGGGNERRPPHSLCKPL